MTATGTLDRMERMRRVPARSLISGTSAYWRANDEQRPPSTGTIARTKSLRYCLYRELAVGCRHCHTHRAEQSNRDKKNRKIASHEDT
ncbi:MAG TPA: hypothetical protein VG900_17445 [Hyphomicrobiaceae bacterium]|nr:hypothetical protein [Hyphomicrobiaceae bacterium]